MQDTGRFYEMYLEKIKRKGGIEGYIKHKQNGPVGAMIERMSRRFDIGDKILEVGTGSGVLGVLLAKNGLDVTAIDNNAEMLDLAKECASVAGVNISFLDLDGFSINEVFPKASFVCSVSYGLMEHFTNQNIVQLLRLQLSVAKTVIFCVPSSSIALKYQQRGNGTERYLSLGEWKRVLRTANIRVKRVYGFGYADKSKYSIFPANIARNNVLSRLFAGFGGFFEFWITSDEEG